MEYIAYIGTLLAIIGSILNLKKHWGGFLFWFTANSLLFVHNLKRSEWAEVVLFAFFQIVCVIGIVKWRKENDGVRDTMD